jgi:hypothetical protein
MTHARQFATSRCATYRGAVYGVDFCLRTVHLSAMEKPDPKRQPLTPPELKCLSIIKDILAANRKPSILEVARLMDIGKSGAQRHMDALREKGRLRGPRVVGEWALTRAGQRALEKRP